MSAFVLAFAIAGIAGVLDLFLLVAFGVSLAGLR